MLLKNLEDPLNVKFLGFHLALFLFWNLNISRKASLKMFAQTDHLALLVG